MEHHVRISDMQYQPASLTINKGDTVIWANADDMNHTATAPYPVRKPYKWDTGTIEPGQRRSVTFNDPSWAGKYGCIFHRSMQGELKING